MRDEQILCLENDDPQRGLELAKAARDNDPTDPIAASWMAFGLLECGMLDELARFVAAEGTLMSTCADGNFVLAKDFARLSEPERAKEAFDLGQSMDATNFLGFYVAADVALVQGGQHGFMEGAKRFMEAFPESPCSYAAMMSATRSTGDSKSAGSTLKSMKEKFGDHPRVAYFEAMILLANHDILEMARNLEAATARHPDNLSLRQELANAYLYTEQYDKSRALLEAVLEQNPNSPGALNSMSNLLEKTGDDRGAEHYKKRFYRAYPVFQRLETSNRLVQLMRKEKHEDALREIDRQLESETFPATLRLLYELRLEILESKEDWTGIQETLEKCEEKGIGLSRGEYFLGRLAEASGNLAEAEAHFVEATLVQGGSLTARSKLLAFYHRHSMREKEEETLRVLIDSLDRGNPAQFIEAVMALEDAKHSEAANTVLANGQLHFPNNPELAMLAAVQRLNAGDMSALKDLRIGGKGRVKFGCLMFLLRFMTWLSKRGGRSSRSRPG